ncbi:MAG: hypothetical protein ACK56F_09960, partial [bacterium]
AKHAVAQQQLRDNIDERTRISTYNGLINFCHEDGVPGTYEGIYEKRGKKNLEALHSLGRHRSSSTR